MLLVSEYLVIDCKWAYNLLRRMLVTDGLISWCNTAFTLIVGHEGSNSTHWGLNKMTAIYLIASQGHFVIWEIYIFIKVSLKVVPEDLIDNKSALLLVMAWCNQVTGHYLKHWWQSSMKIHMLSPMCCFFWRLLLYTLVSDGDENI